MKHTAKPPHPRTPEEAAHRWNNENGIGTAVNFYPVIGKPGHRRTYTESAAYVLHGQTAVVKVHGAPGCVALAACEVVR